MLPVQSTYASMIGFQVKHYGVCTCAYMFVGHSMLWTMQVVVNSQFI